MSRHFPPGPTSRWFVKLQLCASVLLHSQIWILFPFSVWSPLSSRHRPPIAETIGVPPAIVSSAVCAASPSADEQPIMVVATSAAHATPRKGSGWRRSAGAALLGVVWGGGAGRGKARSFGMRREQHHACQRVGGNPSLQVGDSPAKSGDPDACPLVEAND